MKERKSVIGRFVVVAALVFMLAPTRSFGLDGDGTAELVDGVYVVTVQDNDTANLKGADATAANNANAPLAKRGLGTLTAGSGFGSFKGELRVEEGKFSARDSGALGTSDGGTVVSSGATLQLYKNTMDALTFSGESISLAGEIVNASSTGYSHLNAFPGAITITGDDAALKGVSFGLRGTLALDGHTLAIAMNKNNMLLMANVAVTSGGDISVTGSGDRTLKLEGSASWAGSAANTLSIGAGNVLQMEETTGSIPWTLALGQGAILNPSSGGVDFSGNNWDGPVSIDGNALVKSDVSGTCVRLNGPVSGGSLKVSNGTWLELGNPANSFSGGMEVQGDGSGAGGLILAANGSLPVGGGDLTNRNGTVRLSAPAAYDLPDIMVTSSGTLSNDTFGYGGTVASLTKYGAGTYEYNSCLAVTGDTYISKGTLRLGGARVGTAGLVAAVTNFADEATWLAFAGAANRDAMVSKDLFAAATNLLAIGEARGFAVTANRAEAAYNSWSNAEKYKMGAYRGCIWNGDATNKVCTFAASIADTEVLWINGVQIFRSVNSQRFSSSETYFVSIGEAVLKPGPNDFVFLLGHYRTGSFGPKPGSYPQYGLVWAADSGLMYHEGRYVAHDYESGGTTYHTVTNSDDFVNFIDSGDGLLLTTDRNPSAACIAANSAKFRPRFDSLRFGRNADSRCTLDLGGLAGFPQNGLVGCPCVTNGSMVLSGAWTFTSADLAVHPLEVASGAGVTFDNATITASVTGLPRSGTVVLHAEPGATVAGLPSVAVTDGGKAIWELRREESAEGIDLVLWGRPRGMVMTIK